MPAWFDIALAVVLVLVLLIGWMRIVASDDREARNYQAFLDGRQLQRQVRALSEQAGMPMPKEFPDDAAS